MSRKLRAGVIGATGMVGQRFLTLLDNHPFYDVTVVAASSRSAGKKYSEAVDGKWKLQSAMPEYLKDMIVKDASLVDEIAKDVDFVFCAVDMPKEQIKELEYAYARAEVPVVSNNSAHRWTNDVPMIIPEINSDHSSVIDSQKARLGTKRGFVAVKPNCSIQSYVPLLAPLMEFEPTELVVTTYQAISGAGKTFAEFPEIIDNIIPYIGGEEEKSEEEPLKVFGKIIDGEIVNSESPLISAQCYRVPVSDGHEAAVFVNFKNKPTKEDILSRWNSYKGVPQDLNLPSAPKQFIHYFEEDNFPQSKLHRDIENGMAISAGRLREDKLFQWKFTGLSHNTVRGAAGGAVLTAELLTALGYITPKE